MAEKLSLVLMGVDANFPSAEGEPFIERLGKVLGVSTEEAEQLLWSAPVALPCEASFEEAQELEAMLRGIGALVLLARQHAQVVASAPLAPPEAAPTLRDFTPPVF